MSTSIRQNNENLLTNKEKMKRKESQGSKSEDRKKHREAEKKSSRVRDTLQTATCATLNSLLQISKYHEFMQMSLCYNLRKT